MDDRGSLALYGIPGQDAHLLIRCDRREQKIYLSRAGQLAEGNTTNMIIRTTTAAQTFAVASNGAGYASTILAPLNPHLDAMAFSRGRFLVTMDGTADMVVPSWPELTRVIEDCR